MTTIAFDGKIVAADRCVHTDGIIGCCSKISVEGISIGDGELEYVIVAVGGDQDNRIPFIEWLIKGEEKEDKPNFNEGSFEGIVIDASGEVKTYYYNLQPTEMILTSTVPFIAFGSGKLGALVAMRLGLSAVTAIEAVSEFDLYTDCDIECYRVKDLKNGNQTKD